MKNFHKTPQIGDSVLHAGYHYDEEGNLTEQSQFFGHLVSLEQPFFKIESKAGKARYLPANLESFILAPRGEYVCKSTGEVVKDPDFLSCWEIRPAQNASGLTGRPVMMPFYRHDLPEAWDFTLHHDQDYIEAQIAHLQEDYVGKTVLIGISHYRQSGDQEELVRKEQQFGQINAWNMTVGIQVTLKSGETLNLPPDGTLLQPSDFPEYHLRSTGEVIRNPDFVTIWNLYAAE